MSVFEILEGAKFPETTVDVCMRQDLSNQMNELLKEQASLVRALNKEDDQRLGNPRISDEDKERLDQVEAEMEQLQEEMSENILTFHMQGISSGEYNMIQRTAGRPRKEQKIDQVLGYNVQAFYEKAIKRCTHKVSAPDGSEEKFNEENWDALFKHVNDAQFEDLCKGIETVNRSKAKHPTKARSSEEANGSEPSAKQRIALESAINDLSGGNQENAPE